MEHVTTLEVLMKEYTKQRDGFKERLKQLAKIKEDLDAKIVFYDGIITGVNQSIQAIKANDTEVAKDDEG